MDPLYFFILAAVIASFGISFAVRKAFRQIAEGQMPLPKIQTDLMIYTAVAEVLPIVLIILGFKNLDDAKLNPIFVVVVVGAVILFNLLVNFFRYKEASLQLENDPIRKQQIATTHLLSFGLVNAFPVIAIVAAFM